MPGQMFKPKKYLVFLLTLALVWSWAACSLMCGEITDRHEKRSVSSTPEKPENCQNVLAVEDCPYTANAALIEARKTEPEPMGGTANTVLVPGGKFLFFSAFVYPGDRNRISLPRATSDPPLYLKHRAFRI